MRNLEVRKQSCKVWNMDLNVGVVPDGCGAEALRHVNLWLMPRKQQGMRGKRWAEHVELPYL